MSNAVTSLAAVILPSDSNTIATTKNIINTSDSSSAPNLNNLNVNGLSATNKINISNNSSSSSSNSSSSSASLSSSVKTESSSNQMANLNNSIINSNHQQLQQHPYPHHQIHPVQLAGIQYFQYPSASSTTPVNSSPLSSMTSSPSTTNTPTTTASTASLQYHQLPHYQHHHHQPHHAVAFNPALMQQQQQQQQFHSFNPNYKDTRWLTLEVCREYQRSKCNRTETECKFAHPLQHVEIVNGKVIACYDSLKVSFYFLFYVAV